MKVSLSSFENPQNEFYHLGTVSIVTLATLSVHRLMTVKGVPGWKIGSFWKSFWYECKYCEDISDLSNVSLPISFQFVRDDKMVCPDECKKTSDRKVLVSAETGTEYSAEYSADTKGSVIFEYSVSAEYSVPCVS